MPKITSKFICPNCFSEHREIADLISIYNVRFCIDCVDEFEIKTDDALGYYAVKKD